MVTKIEFTPYPTFEEVFVDTDELGKYVFFPLLSIHIENHPEFNNQSFHIVSLWDTGNYEDCYFGKYRIDNYTIHFDLVDNKLAYKDKIEFTKIKYLPEAYQIIAENFEKNIDEILTNDDFNESNIKGNQRKIGGALILAKIPDFGEFEAGHYFKKVTSYLLGKYKSAKGIKTYPELKDFAMEDSEEDFLLSLNIETNLINNVLGNPIWLQGAVELPGTKFIGQVYEASYLSDSSSDLYLFFDKSKKKLTQIYQWS